MKPVRIAIATNNVDTSVAGGPELVDKIGNQVRLATVTLALNNNTGAGETLACNVEAGQSVNIVNVCHGYNYSVE